jgi:hypothetical protein
MPQHDVLSAVLSGEYRFRRSRPPVGSLESATVWLSHTKAWMSHSEIARTCESSCWRASKSWGDKASWGRIGPSSGITQRERSP